MTLNNKPFKKLRHPDSKEELLSRWLYHSHRAIEIGHKFEKEYHKPIYEKVSENIYKSSDGSVVCVNKH